MGWIETARKGCFIEQIQKNVLLGLGGNVGDVRDHLYNSLKFLKASGDVQVIRVSPIYETLPWGLEDQPVFLNICVEINTGLKPESLLQLCHRVEHSLKRRRTVKWGPRTIDIDILMIGEETVKLADLTVPHPRITERAFVLVPLADIAPEWKLEGQSIVSWRQQCDDRGVIKVAENEIFGDLISLSPPQGRGSTNDELNGQGGQ